MRVLWLACVCLAACSSTRHSQLGPYVRNIVPVAGGVGVEQCALDYAHTTQYWSWSPFAGSGNDQDSTLEVIDCTRSAVPTDVAP